jgi:hypothetical protein
VACLLDTGETASTTCSTAAQDNFKIAAVRPADDEGNFTLAFANKKHQIAEAAALKHVTSLSAHAEVCI